MLRARERDPAVLQIMQMAETVHCARLEAPLAVFKALRCVNVQRCVLGESELQDGPLSWDGRGARVVDCRKRRETVSELGLSKAAQIWCRADQWAALPAPCEVFTIECGEPKENWTTRWDGECLEVRLERGPVDVWSLSGVTEIAVDLRTDVEDLVLFASALRNVGLLVRVPRCQSTLVDEVAWGLARAVTRNQHLAKITIEYGDERITML